MMQYCAKIHNAGLMTDENFTGTYDTQIEKLASGQVFSVIGCMGDFGDGFSSLVANDPNVNIVPVGPLMPSDGTPLACHSSSMVGWIMTAIPVTSKNPNRLIALMNYIYSEEGKFLITVGVEGETYTLNADGKAVLKPEIKAEFDADSTAARLKWGFGGATTNEGVMWMEFDRVWGANHAVVPTDKWSVMFKNWMSLTKDVVFSQAAFQNLNTDLTAEESDILAKVNNIRNEEMAKILLCKTPAEEETAWNTYVAKVDALGFDKVLAAQNLKFQQHKKALGLTFAWPPNIK
jgi:putative aldouronate transport system substrate-binding protein